MLARDICQLSKMTVRRLHGRSRCELAVVGEKVDRSCTASKSATSGV